MVKSAIEHMRAIQMQSLAAEVGYTPLGGEARTIRAVVGRTVFRSTDVDGIWTRIETRDFIVSKEQLSWSKRVSLLIQVRQAKLGRTNSGRSYIVKKSTYD